MPIEAQFEPLQSTKPASPRTTVGAKTDDASTTSPTAAASSSPPAAASSKSDGGLSRGAKVAIGVVIPVVALVVAIIVCGVMRRRSVRRRQEQATQAQAGSEKRWRSDNKAQSQDVKGPPAYVSEMQGSQSALSELPSGKGAAATYPFEMPSTESGRTWNAVELPVGT
ncbi:hypothetical protein PV05_00304 [Exophiala xenobiotica]|uniref:Mid2 domain-containing protein n=1 Tax=Exophiala xenobiotica TaxID=348802 RepID=A0A0D2EZH1_9EURO|nr:uncharacterized protein PV05_00304 [Exophiala xenobiotica]KIW60055.1 hypothetical protein PV05_00304 [Exophiala xenobiotica]